MELEVLEEDNRIIFYTRQNVAKKKTKVDVSGRSAKIIYSLLNVMYTRGDDEIEVTFSNQKELSDIKLMVTLLVGFVVIKETKNTCTLKDVGGTIAEDMDEVIKRIFVLVNSFVLEAESDLKEGCKYDEETIIWKDKDINKLVSLAQRTLNKKSELSKEQSQALFNIITHLEHLGDNIGRIWRTTSKHNLKLDDELSHIFSLAKKSIEKIFESYYRFNDKVNEELVKLRDEAREMEMSSKKTNPASIRFVRYAIEICDECVDMMHSVFILRL
jgi:phosphate uptake regulator